MERKNERFNVSDGHKTVTPLLFPQTLPTQLIPAFGGLVLDYNTICNIMLFGHSAVRLAIFRSTCVPYQ